ncbi:MAG: deoxyribose-phosphate aldolase [Gemmatimonadota bacterium]|nr:MAG: deoxyribose-phosphate aldolase [Gemmatimonadota bacterium]
MTDRSRVLPLDLEALHTLSADEARVKERARALAAGVPARGSARVGDLVTAVTAIDLTTLSDDDTVERVRQLCRRAQTPLSGTALRAVPPPSPAPHVAAVCVAERFVAAAVGALAGSRIPVAAATGDFPRGQAPLEQRLGQIRAAVRDGADEIDVVITRDHARGGVWQVLYDEVRAFRDAAGDALLKVILATGDLGTLETVARAATTAMLAGADFIKTSTGKEQVNATLAAGIVMADMIRRHHDRTGIAVGLKPAGGIRTAQRALEWIQLVRRELGDRWLTPERFRIGASGLLDDLQRELAELDEGSLP